MSIPDQMILIDQLTDQDGVPLPVHRDYDHAIVGKFRLDLDGISALVAALDITVAEIRRFQARAAEAAEADA